MSLFALKTLISDRGKLLIALIGVVFSLVLINVQGGLFLGLIQKASLLIDHTDADIWVTRRGVENVDLPASIPVAWINRVRGLPDVVAAEPYILGNAGMYFENGEFEPVWLIGSDPASMLGSAWDFSEGDLNQLRRPNAISVDELDSQKLNNPQIGDVVEINFHRARVVAKTRDTQNFITTPIIFTTIDSARHFTGMPEHECSYFLVQASENADLDALTAAIRKRLPETDVHTANDFRSISQAYWMKRTGIGISFGASTLLGVIVGLLMVAQSLYALVLDHLSEYATLKAMGADGAQVCRVVILQALAIAGAGSVLGVAAVLLIEQFVSTPLAPILIPFNLLLGGIGVVFCICLLASILPYYRIHRLDPAIVLQG